MYLFPRAWYVFLSFFLFLLDPKLETPRPAVKQSNRHLIKKKKRSKRLQGPETSKLPPKWLGEGAKGVLVYAGQRPVALVQKRVALVLKRVPEGPTIK